MTILQSGDASEPGTRRFRLLEVGIGTLFFGIFTALLLSGSLDGLENRTIDWRYRMRALQEPKAKIALVLITDDCLPQLGSWPISRSFYATLVDRLASAGAKTIAFDIMFEDLSSADPGGDAAFIESCRRFGRVLFPQVFYEGYEDSSMTKLSENYSLPFDGLAESAAGFGYINADFEYLNPDGILQKTFLTHRFEDEWYRCYSLAIAEQVTGRRAAITDGGVTLGDTCIPLIDLPPWKPIKGLWHGGTGKAVYINFLGDRQREPFPTCKFSDLVRETALPATFWDVFAPSVSRDASIFRDAIVFVGPSAKGLGDLRITPHGLKPGVIVHANLLENILASNFLEAPSLATQVGLLVVFASFTFGVLCWEGAFVASTAVFAGMLSVYAGFCFLMFSGWRLVLPMTIPLLMSVVQYVVVRFVQLITNLKRANAILSEQNIKLDQKVRELMALHSAGSRFPAILEMSILSREVIAKFCELRGADAGLLVFFEPQSGQAQPLGQVAGTRGETYIQKYRTELAERLRTVFETKRPLTVPGSHLYSSYMPLLVGEACWGAVCLHDTDAERLPWQSENFWATLLGISGTALQNARLYEMACEVSLARQVQANFLPKKPLELNGYRVFGHSRPATQLGGDYFDYFVVDDRHLVVMIADVMGHGVPAALGMAIVKTSVLQRTKDGFSIENLVNTINYTLMNSQERRLMVTAQFTVIDTIEHRATIYHRGHVFPFRRAPDGTWTQQRCTIAPPLGVMKQAQTPGTPVEILPGERWLFYTDGLYESLGEGGEDEMKIVALQTYLGTRPFIPLTDACSDILDHHPSFLTGQPQPDDYTVLLLERVSDSGIPDQEKTAG